jgi:hypothetical protein
LGAAVRGRDETAVVKTVAAFLKLLHPGNDPTEEELNEYLEIRKTGCALFLSPPSAAWRIETFPRTR